MNSKDVLTNVMKVYQSSEEPERRYAIAGKYWRIMLTAAVLVGMLAVAGGTYMLVLTFINMNINRSQTGSATGLNRKDLTKVVTGLSARQAAFNALITSSSTAPIADPSR